MMLASSLKSSKLFISPSLIRLKMFPISKNTKSFSPRFILLETILSALGTSDVRRKAISLLWGFAILIGFPIISANFSGTKGLLTISFKPIAIADDLTLSVNSDSSTFLSSVIVILEIVGMESYPAILAISSIRSTSLSMSGLKLGTTTSKESPKSFSIFIPSFCRILVISFLLTS